MKIAVLSGKGGTGKTFVASNLAAAAKNSTYLDCDVEEPNGHLFLKGLLLEEINVSLPVPGVDHELCNSCRKCIDFCSFNALAYIGGQVKVFEKICHSCGGCSIVCPQEAISEIGRTIGHIERRRFKEVDVLSGNLNPGEESGTSIIKKLISMIPVEQNTVIIDSPPGSACIVMDSIKDADYCLLVAEPTTFGAHNLKMVHELTKIFGKPCGAVLNKSGLGDNPSQDYCLKNGIPILLDIPWRRDISDLIAQGELAVEMSRELNETFSVLLEKIRREVL